MSKEIIERMVNVMKKNGFIQVGNGPNFKDMEKGGNKIFLTWGEVYDFIRKGF